uniref:NADH-ubiquinone oxidoreductase chain 6 n=1 Tax=Lucanus imitator TaxID=618023 RepID=A0AB38ZGH0_9SCAR
MLMLMSMLMIPPAILPVVQHPLSAGFLLLMEMTLIILSVSLISMSFWYSYITFLIMIGGMLVLFMYMTSVASNEKFKFSWTSLALIISALLLMTGVHYTFFWTEYIKIANTEELKTSKSLLFSLNKFLNEPSYTLSLILIIYLLITLIVVIKIVNINSGPMRHMN